MWPFAAILAGVLANKMQSDEADAQAKKQAIAGMHMDMARRFAPDMPTYGFQAAQLRSQMDARRDAGQQQMIGQLLPIALANMGSLSAAPAADSTRGFSSAVNGHLGADFNAAQPTEYPINPLRELEEEMWDPERPMY